MNVQSGATSTAPYGHHDRFFIGGEWMVPSSTSTIEVISPITEEVYVRIAEAQAPDVERAVAAARAAFDRGPWPRMSHQERAAYLRAIAHGLNERASDVALTWPSEMGILHSIAESFAGGDGGSV